ncbi:phytanoyl-CoA dioxygenase family protein [Nonomuraea soli]|uniref:Fe2OG dioxygenase domain-containing protein n=1 Tax=Nonomuraea soli TaxID=1032476 RepID=A0A7W0CDT3_9ACTN|nr:phytanoyl-CoA dioxygenase family protein [Nonomuraea soli]MBA2889311.1 hypothetical protein [Nonomuraea soli]
MRDVTDHEIAAFRRDGWVHLPGLVEEVGELRERAIERLRARSTAHLTLVDEAFGQSRDVALEERCFAGLMTSFGPNAVRLLHGVDAVRVQVTNLLVKEPGEHGATEFHQDFPWMPMDRSAMLTLWVALVDVPAEMGSLRFYTGSHAYGLLGRSFVREGDDQITAHPWLRDLTLSPPLDLAAGDATVHHSLTVHGAPANRASGTRLSFTATYFDAETLYTGAPYKQTDELELKVNQPFDHPRFPCLRP